MNAGRTAAQCAHAANYFVKEANALIECLEDPYDPFIVNYKTWENQTDQAYGTTIVLDGGSETDILLKLDAIEDQYLTGIVRDPEYPLQDGKFTHTLKNVVTCAFAFPYNFDDCLLKDLELYGKN